MFSDVIEFSFVNPSSETYPNDLNAASKDSTASNGSVVPSGAV